MKIAVVGATGLIGRAIIEHLQLSNWDVLAIASQRSAGQTMSLAGRQYFIYAIEQVDFSEIDWVFFSAGGAVSSQYVPKVLAQGCRVIDNSSYFRMHPDVPLVAFSVNHEMCQSAPLIANPNCSTIQLAVALNPLLHLEPSQVIITSMQSISGAGRGAMANLKEDTRCMLQSGAMQGMAFDLDTKIDVWADAGYCKEEWKIRHELPKILGIDVLIGVTTVRVPVLFAHSQSVTVTLKRSVSLSELISLFEDSPLIRVYAHEDIFSPMKVSYGNANVHVGRIRPVGTDGLVWNFMVISDNILRGGATNAFEILRSLVSVNE